jgi:hypothetical protein
MAQHDYVIANGTGAAVRSDLNGSLAAIVSNNSGATEPGTMYAYQWWPDTTTGLLKIRNAANNEWVTVGTLASANLGLLSLAGGTMTGVLAVTAGTAALPGIAVSGDLNTGLVSPGADQLAITTGGTSRLAVSTTAVSSTLAVDHPLGAVGTPSITFTGDLNTGLFSSGADAIDIATAGTRRFGVSSAGELTVYGGNLTLNGQGDLRLADSDSSNYVALQAPATVASNVTFTLPSADGTNGQVLATNGTGTLSFTAAGGITSGTAVASTSGTSIDFTGIPSYVKRITVMFAGVSTNGSSNYRIQFGAGSIQTTGYNSNCLTASSVAAATTTNVTAGFDIGSISTAGATLYGSAIFSLLGSDSWVCQGQFSNIGDSRSHYPAGAVALSGTLDRIRITTANGTDTFDAGSINILYEG